VASGIDARVVKYVDGKHDLIRVGRILRTEYNLANKQTAVFNIRASNKTYAQQIEDDMISIMALLRAEEINVDVGFTPDSAMPSGMSTLGTIYMSIEGLVDVDAEIMKLAGELDEVTRHLENVKKKLSNESFVSKAPKDVVAVQEKRKEELIEKSEKLKKMIDMLNT
jgi:valyl-tRNA synthetase